MKLELHREAEQELGALPHGEQYAMQNAFEKLTVYGDKLPFPRSSKVKGAAGLRELRPRAGRSPWRAFYGRIGDTIVIVAIGPEAQADPRGFHHAVQRAGERLVHLEQERRNDATNT